MSINLFDYQLKCINFLKINNGIILYHSMGSGKTITSLISASQFVYPIIIISTKSSAKNFNDDIKKIIKDKVSNFEVDYDNLAPENIKIVSYKKIISLILKKNISLKEFTVIVDEAHHLRSQTKLINVLLSELINAQKIILLTGTIFYNSLIDISPLINLIKRREVLPLSLKEFDFYYYDSNYEAPTNTDIFIDQIQNSISRYKIDSENDPNYPKSTVEYKHVNMSNEQISVYRHYLRKILSLHDIQHIDFSIIDKRKANNFLTVTRQLSNTVNESIDSPKIIQVFEFIKSKINIGQIIVYSNFLNNGVLPVSLLLKKENISHQVFHGAQSETKRESIINGYNNKDFKVLLITSVGSESLDLKNTRFINIMEPHWNESKTQQIIGRSIRFNSHSSLPYYDRNVVIVHWYSVFGYKIPYETADEYLIKLSKKKSIMFNQFDQLIKKASI